MPRIYVKIPIIERFWAKVEKTRTCWLWTAGVSKAGYGQIGAGGEKGKILYAHRLSYEMHIGPIPPGKLVLHSCDVRRCVNPEHFFLGTHAVNSRDMVSKNRQRKGETHQCAKLSEKDILIIRGLGGVITHLEIARKFNVTRRHIGQIISRRVWRHI